MFKMKETLASSNYCCNKIVAAYSCNFLNAGTLIHNINQCR
jgi:hypothetical protein